MVNDQQSTISHHTDKTQCIRHHLYTFPHFTATCAEEVSSRLEHLIISIITIIIEEKSALSSEPNACSCRSTRESENVTIRSAEAGMRHGGSYPSLTLAANISDLHHSLYNALVMEKTVRGRSLPDIDSACSVLHAQVRNRCGDDNRVELSPLRHT